MSIVITNPIMFLGAVGVHGFVFRMIFDGITAFDVVANLVISH